MILGLDISTSCTGFSIIDKDKNLIEMNSVSLSKKKCLYEKTKDIEKAFKNIEKYNIDTIYVEENLQAFRTGFSSAKTISTLARFNGMVSLIAFNTFGILPENINVNQARKVVGIKIIKEKICGKSTKEQVVDWVDKDLLGVEWPTKVLKSGPRKGKKIIDSSSYDMADSYVIAVAGLKMNI